MIRADVRDVDCRDAILQDADPIFAETADDGATRARPEVGGADARLAVKRFTDGGLERELELFTGEDGDGLGLLEKIAAERRAADDDPLMGGCVFLGFVDGAGRGDGLLCAQAGGTEQQCSW